MRRNVHDGYCGLALRGNGESKGNSNAGQDFGEILNQKANLAKLAPVVFSSVIRRIAILLLEGRNGCSFQKMDGGVPGQSQLDNQHQQDKNMSCCPP